MRASAPTQKYNFCGIQKRRSAFAERRSSLQFSRKGELVELLSVLPSRFRLLLTLQAGADIMLSLLDLSDDASLCTAALEPLQSIFQGFAFLDANFRHCFPSLRRKRLDPACFQGRTRRPNYYIQRAVNCQEIFLPFSAKCSTGPVDHFTIRFTSLFLTWMTLTICLPSVNFATFSCLSASATTVS